MMKKQTALRVAMLAALAAGFGHPSRVLAANGDGNGFVRSEVTFALDTNIINGCYVGENVHILGKGVLHILTRVKSDGTVEVKELDRFSGEGIGDTSGAQYQFNELAHIDTSLGPNPDFPIWSGADRG